MMIPYDLHTPLTVAYRLPSPTPNPMRLHGYVRGAQSECDERIMFGGM